VTGVVRMRGTVVNGPISTVDLDLNASMTVTAVWNNDIPSSYSRTGDVISVSLGSSYANRNAPGHPSRLPGHSSCRLVRL
jgi:hypothetical protein